ncbi:helix-turn-helix domain-containing protein [Pseudoflavonifractor phocaeensis]|uniref:helix-turn-helix domain-containing protein n=1 Tax=Pseudoflavonifractor phocaeensis TaxID=1870988 RepID=UPI001955FEDC|nr:helix-turn-helix domain-containing protein [Pseudoflavonifractor phocaeensis]MBM6926389.1 LysR family transcriptional regulator [Pseudoflavonifractor phocaeensis]
MENKRFLNADDVAQYLNVSVPTAYKIIRRLNQELSAMGYLVVAGRVSRTYFEQKVYGGATA